MLPAYPSSIHNSTYQSGSLPAAQTPFGAAPAYATFPFNK